MKRIKKYLFLLLTAILLFAQPMPQVQAFTTTAATGQVKLNKKSLTIAYTKTAKLKLKMHLQRLPGIQATQRLHTAMPEPSKPVP